MNPTRSSQILAMFGLCCGGLAEAQITLPFDAPHIVADERQQIVATLDLNGDGWQDAMGWWLDGPGAQNPDNGNLHGWINDGTGKLVLAWDVPYVGSSDSTIPRETIAVHGFDSAVGDDWALVADNRIRVFLSNGGQPPTLAVDFDAGSPMRAIAVANFDAGDITRELAVAHFDGTLAVYEVLLGAGTLQLVSTRAAGIPIVGPLVAAEFTGDSAADLLVSGARLFPSVGGVLQPFSVDFGFASDPQTYMFAHDVGDLDGDGDVDVVTFSMNAAGDSRTRVLRRTGPAALVAEPVHAGGPARRLADIDNDGDLDGVCCGGGGGASNYTNDEASTFRLALNDGTGQFAPSIEWPGLGSKAIAGAVDLDHDGDLDLVAGRNVHYAQGPLAAQPMQETGFIGIRNPWVGDVDGDGDLDFDLKLEGYQRNRGDGVFKPWALTLPPPPPGKERIGEGYAADWDGDGDPDLLAPLNGTWGQGGMELLLNTAPARFESAGVVDSTEAPYVDGLAERAWVGDRDGDGDLDLFLRSNVNGWNFHYRNDGPAGFQFMAQLGGLELLDLADLDGDGVLDAIGGSDVVASGNTGSMYWAPGTGQWSFGTWTKIPEATVFPATQFNQPFDRFVAKDLDGDGDTDIATYFRTGTQPYEARILWNQGSAVFSVEDLGFQSLSTYGSLVGNQRGVVALDVQGDGHLDLVFGPLAHTTNAVTVLLRESDGIGFQPPLHQTMLQSYGISSYPFRMNLAAGDLDGDGDPELIGKRAANDTRFDGPAAGQRLQIGPGVPGQGDIVPLLGAVGPFRVGETVELRLCGLPPGATGWVTFDELGPESASPTSGSLGRLLGGPAVPHLPIVASGASGDPVASGTWKLRFVVQPGMAGSTWHYRAVMNDAAAEGGKSVSNLLVLTYGN